MERYNVIRNKNPREILLLKSFPCAWGKCTFCDYINDNSKEEEEMVPFNSQILSRVTGELGVLEVINSGSCFELPKATTMNSGNGILINTQTLKRQRRLRNILIRLVLWWE